MTLDLKDPHYPEHNLGTLELSVTLSPKEGDVRDAVRNPHKITRPFLSHTLLSFILGATFQSAPKTHPRRHVELQKRNECV